MVSPLQLSKRAGCLLGLFAALTATSSATGISATASFTATLTSPGLYDYSITLNNTGTTNIGTFWFAWIASPAAGFLSSAPANVTSPAGWSDILTNGSAGIQWTSTSAPLAAAQSLSGFSFFSTETPAQLLGTVPTGAGAGDPITTSFVYIGAPFRDPGEQIVVAQTVSQVPEPGSMLLTLTGFGLAASTLRPRLRRSAA